MFAFRLEAEDLFILFASYMYEDVFILRGRFPDNATSWIGLSFLKGPVTCVTGGENGSGWYDVTTRRFCLFLFVVA